MNIGLYIRKNDRLLSKSNIIQEHRIADRSYNMIV